MRASGSRRQFGAICVTLRQTYPLSFSWHAWSSQRFPAYSGCHNSIPQPEEMAHAYRRAGGAFHGSRPCPAHRSRRNQAPRLPAANGAREGPNPLELLPEIGERRLRSMDEAGITVQVLSNTGPGPDLVPGPDGVALAREMNDHLAAAIARLPDRFAGFAVLPMQSPIGRRRGVCSRGEGICASSARLSTAPPKAAFSTTRSYRGLLAAAVELDVPIYIHPHLAPEAVRQAYFANLEAGAGRVLETAGWGWHSETAIHVLRMVLAGPRRIAAPAHHRTHGRNAANDAGPHRRGLRPRYRAPEAADQPHHP